MSFHTVASEQVSSHLRMLPFEDAECVHFLVLPYGQPLSPVQSPWSDGSKSLGREARSLMLLAHDPHWLAGHEGRSSCSTNGLGQQGWMRGQGHVAGTGFRAAVTNKEI